MTTPGWCRDPVGAGDGRYWDGRSWTDQVTRAGATVTSPIATAQANIPPAPGTEFVAAPPAVPPQPAPVAPSGGGGHSVAATVIAAVAVAVGVVALVIALTRDTKDDDGDNKPQQPTEQPQPTAPAEEGEG